MQTRPGVTWRDIFRAAQELCKGKRVVVGGFSFSPILSGKKLEDRYKVMLSANLHDLGKLPKTIRLWGALTPDAWRQLVRNGFLMPQSSCALVRYGLNVYEIHFREWKYEDGCRMGGFVYDIMFDEKGRVRKNYVDRMAVMDYDTAHRLKDSLDFVGEFMCGSQPKGDLLWDTALAAQTSEVQGDGRQVRLFGQVAE